MKIARLTTKNLKVSYIFFMSQMTRTNKQKLFHSQKRISETSSNQAFDE